MGKKAWTIAKVNFRALNVLVFLAFTTFAALFISNLISFLVMSGAAGHGSDISPINALWLLPVMAGIALPAYNFRRIINLGGKREDFFWGCLVTYVILAAVVSLIVTISNFTIEPLLERHEYYDPSFLGGIVNLTEVFGWANNGFIAGFFQQFALLFLFSVFVHVFTAAQGKWYGWVAAVGVIAIISVFTPIAPLRRSLVWFFNLILFHDNALVQILACLVIGAGVYLISRPVLARKTP
ncbi:MAG: hypothetical protein FWE42_04000 [Defluviitaleaceae bacterium]|nr:hypothetical protein [Defluviitaleaceae bacterium]